MTFLERIPKLKQIAPVYSVIVFIVYSWTIFWFFWKFNSWTYYLRPGEIFTILAYTLSVNLFESLLVLLLPITLSVLMPRKWFLDQFVARGAALVLAGLCYLIYVAYQFKGRTEFHQTQVMRLSIPVFFVILFLVFAAGKWSLLRKAFESIADRTTIFLYILIPISIISLLIVIVRNLL
jgi:hypothetical protein